MTRTYDEIVKEAEEQYPDNPYKQVGMLAYQLIRALENNERLKDMLVKARDVMDESDFNKLTANTGIHFD